MTLQKIGQPEQAEVFRGREATIVNSHMAKTGKAVSEFDQDELQSLNSELESVRESKEQTTTQNLEPQKSVTDKDEPSSVKSSSKKNVKPLNG